MLKEKSGPKQKGLGKMILIAVLIVSISIITYAWFFVISPTFVTKPGISKPALTAEPEEGHVNWLVNELGSYKLHPDPLSGEPAVMEIVVTDLGRTFTSTTENNMPSTTEGAATSPDIRISITSEYFARLYQAEDASAEAVALFNEGNAEIELLKSETELATKGYKGIYDELGL